MKSKNKLILCISMILVLQSFIGGTSHAQENKDEECVLIIDTLLLPKAVITDSVLFPIIDSAISMIKTETIFGYRIPYCIKLFPTSEAASLKYLLLKASNIYTHTTSIEAIKKSYDDCVLIQYGEYQILVSTLGLSNSWFQDCIQIKKELIPYYVYGFCILADRKLSCINDKVITQEISFCIRPNKNRPYLFEKYSYFIDPILYTRNDDIE